ncbi:MAG: hypothetical protein WCP16_24130 [Pseudanabaena sp. ELA645]|jgi:hypothetical protein
MSLLFDQTDRTAAALDGEPFTKKSKRNFFLDELGDELIGELVMAIIFL